MSSVYREWSTILCLILMYGILIPHCGKFKQLPDYLVEPLYYRLLLRTLENQARQLEVLL